jgi:hypothetical protein
MLFAQMHPHPPFAEYFAISPAPMAYFRTRKLDFGIRLR